MRIIVIAALLLGTVHAQQLPPTESRPKGGKVKKVAPSNTAEIQVKQGQFFIKEGSLDAAQAECAAAYEAEPSNIEAQSCLTELVKLKHDRDLSQAEAYLIEKKRVDAIALAAAIAEGNNVTNEQRNKAWQIIQAAKAGDLARQVTGDWTFKVIAAIVFVAFICWLLYGYRAARRWWRRFRTEGITVKGILRQKTKWKLLPVQEDPKENLVGADLILDALSRLPSEVDRNLWTPKLLLLKSTPPARYEPELIQDFLCTGRSGMVLAQRARDLKLDWELHDIELDDAVRELQLKFHDVDVGSVAKFARRIWRWLDSGTPTLTGAAWLSQNNHKDEVWVRLSASGGPNHFFAVTASTPLTAGPDATRLSAERAVFKLLFRMNFPDKSAAEVDGQASLRQGVQLLEQYAAVPEGADGQDAHIAASKTRITALKTAACSLAFFADRSPA